jgi:V/A-type H+-transporting ATPase subunit D
MDTSTLPTKNNLIKLQNKIKLSTQGHELLEKKKVILNLEKSKYEERRNLLKKEMDKLMKNARNSLINACIDIGIDELENISNEVNLNDEVTIRYKTLMGVEIASITTKQKKEEIPYSLYRTTSSVDKTIKDYNEVKATIIQLAEIENAIYRLTIAISKVSTRSNALENIIIPNDQKIEAEIKNILEEREREEFSRLKVMKNAKK